MGKPLSLHLLNLFSVLAFLCAVANGTSYVFGFVSNIKGLSNASVTHKSTQLLWVAMCLNLYGVLFSVIAFLVELRVATFFAHAPVFKIWAFRGFYYIFLGVLNLGLVSGEGPFNSTEANNTWHDVSEVFSYCMCGVGALYIVGDILCLRPMMQQKKRQHVQDGTVFSSSLV
mmetsp:Transcript_6417/g.14158  ORF Transcript_6417/g.14158 Transcript_6417/m.14158 type:complete len:172 (+) Transcript_6417:111-626(+)